jgi:antitoxin YefM
MDSVVDDHAFVVVARQRGEAVVMVSLADWRAMEETLHRLSSLANAERLCAAMDELERDGGGERDLIEP